MLKLIKSFIILALLYVEACKKFARRISESLRPGYTGSFKETLQRWRVVGNITFHLIGPRFGPQTSHSRDECVTARPTAPIFRLFCCIERLKIHYVWSFQNINQKDSLLQQRLSTQTKGNESNVSSLKASFQLAKVSGVAKEGPALSVTILG